MIEKDLIIVEQDVPGKGKRGRKSSANVRGTLAAIREKYKLTSAYNV